MAYSRNWLPSQRGHPSPSLLERTRSELAGGSNVTYKSIAIFPSTFPLFPSSTSIYSARNSQHYLGLHIRAPLLATLVSFVVPCLAQAFCGRQPSRSLFLIRLFNRGPHPFSSFGNLI